jgi:hypothetical protein
MMVLLLLLLLAESAVVGIGGQTASRAANV